MYIILIRYLHIHNCQDHLLKFKPEQYTSQLKVMSLNTFTAIGDLSRFNNSCLRLSASTLVDLIFSVVLFQLKLADLSLYSSFSISSWRYLYPFYSWLCLHCDIMNPCLSLRSEWELAVSGCSLYRIFYTWSRVCVTVYTSQCNMASRKRKTIGFRTEKKN